MRKKSMSSKNKQSGVPKLPLLIILAGIAVGGLFYFANKAEQMAPPLEEIRMEATNVEIR
jgi:hypothetical protein